MASDRRRKLADDEVDGHGDVPVDLTRIEELEAQVAENLDLAQRKQAEFENYRRRQAREREEFVIRASERVVGSLLPVLDNLERAIEHAVAEGETGELLHGVEMVRDQILGVLAGEGVEVQDPFGQIFDPALHQAVAQQEDTEILEGTVVEVYHKGYVMSGRVIRPASVVVSTGGPSRETDQP